MARRLSLSISGDCDDGGRLRLPYLAVAPERVVLSFQMVIEIGVPFHLFPQVEVGELDRACRATDLGGEC